MALTVQTVSGETGADSYLSLSEARSIAVLNGWTLSDDDDVLEAALRSAMIYIESHKFKGTRQTKELSFPRFDLYRDSFLVDPIPEEILIAQARLASYAIASPIMPERSRVKKFRLEGVYSQETQDPDTMRRFHDVKSLIDPFTYSGRPVVGRL